MDDTISRAAVVDAIEGVDWYHQKGLGLSVPMYGRVSSKT